MLYYILGTSVRIDGVSFDNSETAIQSIGGSHTFSRLVFSQHSIHAIRFESNTHLTSISGCFFHKNTIAISAMNSVQIQVTNSSFEENGNSTTLGSSIYLENSNIVTITNDFFSNTGLAGTIALVNSTLYCTHATFSQNEASEYGGAMAISANSTFYGEHLIFYENYLVGDGVGGAISVDGAKSFVIHHSTFTGNTAQVGGALDILNSVTLITNTTFESHSGTIAGAISVSGGTAVVSSSKFNRNLVTTDYGGAIVVRDGASLLLYDTTFTNNKALAGKGGAIFANRSLMHGERVHFEGNNATEGGAIHLIQSTYNISDSTFTNNNAIVLGGGAIALYALSSGIISNVSFSKCKGLRGAFHIYDSEAIISNSTFTSNSATSSGGALVSTRAGKVELYTCTFSGNYATNGGAIFLNDQSEAKIWDVDCFENSATVNGGCIRAELTNGIDILYKAV